VDYDLWRNHQDRAAILFSFQAVATKLNQGLGGAVALGIPAWFGLGAQGPLDDRAVLGLTFGMVLWPCLLLLPMSLMAWRHPLGRRAHRLLSRRLARRLGNPS
jgi:glycoside/pentoside/hexuronide:cation symporter, GPH family